MISAEQIAAFVESLPERSVLFVHYEEAALVQAGVDSAGRSDVDVLPQPFMVRGDVLAKSHYALAVGERGWFFSDWLTGGWPAATSA